MASTIAAITTGIGGIVTTADATGNLSLLSGTSTVVAITSAGAAVTGTMSVSGATTLTGGLNTPLAVTSGGTGLGTLTANNVILGAGTSNPTFVAPSTTGNLLTSNGTTWTSAAAPASGVTTFNGSTTGLTPATATSGAITLGGTLAVANGGTGVTTSTGTGATVLSTSPTLVTPALGTPASGVLSNCTGVARAALPAGSVLQVVQTVKVSTFSTLSATYVDVTGLTASITPISTSNKILVTVTLYASSSPNTAAGQFQLLRGATAIAGGTASGNIVSSIGPALTWNAVAVTPVFVNYLDSPSTTSSTTYKVQVYAQNTSTTIGVGFAVAEANTNLYGRYASVITLQEIAG